MKGRAGRAARGRAADRRRQPTATESGSGEGVDQAVSRLELRARHAARCVRALGRAVGRRVFRLRAAGAGIGIGRRLAAAANGHVTETKGFFPAGWTTITTEKRCR